MIQNLLVKTSTCSYPGSKFSTCSFLTERLALHSRHCWKDSGFPCFPNWQWQGAILRFCCGSKSILLCFSWSWGWFHLDFFHFNCFLPTSSILVALLKLLHICKWLLDQRDFKIIQASFSLWFFLHKKEGIFFSDPF